MTWFSITNTLEARDFSLRLARTEDESGDDHYAVMDGSGNVIYRSANSSAASMAELFIYDENGKQAGEVCFDGGAPAITQYSYVDEWGNEIAKRSIDAKNDSDFVRVCEWMNTQTGEVRQSDDLLEFEQEHNYLGSYVSLEGFGTDPAKECAGCVGLFQWHCGISGGRYVCQILLECISRGRVVSTARRSNGDLWRRSDGICFESV